LLCVPPPPPTNPPNPNTPIPNPQSPILDFIKGIIIHKKNIYKLYIYRNKISKKKNKINILNFKNFNFVTIEQTHRGKKWFIYRNICVLYFLILIFFIYQKLKSSFIHIHYKDNFIC